MASLPADPPTQTAAAPAAQPNAAIQYHPDSYDAARPKVMGRHAAGEGFLKGLVAHSGVPAFYAFTPSRNDFDHFTRRVAAMGGRGRPTYWVAPGRYSLLAEVGCLYLAGPGLGETAWQRRLDDDRRYSLCGITHTVSSDRAMDALGELLLAPTQSWDAVVCTSRAVKAAVERMVGGYADYIAQRVGARPALPIQLPIIPLGVDAGAFAASTATEAMRAELRQRLQIAASDVALLFFGRLAFHAKAHPVPMLLAAQLAHELMRGDAGTTRLHFLMVGQFPNNAIAAEFRTAAPRYCPDVTVHFLDGADPPQSRAAWFAGDIFFSLSDNIQESFGITPLEAMAAGIPCVVSDWDGYRDTVTEGETGFRIKTTMPPPTDGGDLVPRYVWGIDTYDRYIGAVSQATAVDVRAAADAIRRLAGDLALRQSLGEAGRRRAAAFFDWRPVIGQYQALWRELALRRRTDKLAGAGQAGLRNHGLRPDPFDMFQGHSSTQLGADVSLRTRGEDAAARLEQILSMSMNTFTGHLMLQQDEIRRMVAELAGRSRTVGELSAGRPDTERRLLMRTIAWLKKYDIVDF